MIQQYIARMAVLLAGLPVEVGGITVNSLCASGLDAIAIAARTIKSDEAEMIIAGDVESMSRAPFVIPKANTAYSRNTNLHDTTIGWRFINPKIEKIYGADSMPTTADNVALEFKISREDQDKFAYRSQQRWLVANNKGLFKEEICPVMMKSHKQSTIIIDKDEHPRPGVTLDQLAKLPGINGGNKTVTAGNSSGINDGSAALLIGNKNLSKNIQPKASILSSASFGVMPRIMGIGPLYASIKVLKRVGLTIKNMDIIELNEAFAAQALAVLRAFGIPDDAKHVNPNGGAIAIGHPLGMSGARLVVAATNELQRIKGRFALYTMCVGVGQGVAMIIERVNSIN